MTNSAKSSTKKTKLAIVDTETTGTHPFLHEVWEIAVIQATHHIDRRELFVESTNVGHVEGVSLSTADPMALLISGFYDRYDTTEIIEPERVARLLAGRLMVGAVPGFDATFIRKWLRNNLLEAAWHYHPIDVEALVAGYLAGHPTHEVLTDLAAPPWKSDDLAEAVGVSISEEARHTALGDARWAMAQYAAVYGLTIVDPDCESN